MYMNSVPYVLEKTGSKERVWDLWSRLHEDRIIFLGEPINDRTANLVVAQLLFLSAQNEAEDIMLYINSPGGHVTSGLAIYDTMNHIPNDVQTICTGQAASMGAVLLAGGTKGKRFALPNASIMIHQPLGDAQGQSADIQIAAKRIEKVHMKLASLLSDDTGNSVKKLLEDMDRNNWMSSEEACEYGIIDTVLTPKLAGDSDSDKDE